MICFISLPMKNKTREEIENNIKKMKEIAIFKLNCKVDFINTIVEDKPPYNTQKEAVWYLGKSIEILSKCDAIVCLKNVGDYNGCFIEKEIAKRYGLDIIEVEL